MPSMRVRRVAEEDAMTTIGVRSLANHLAVKPDKDWIPPSDDELRARVINQLAWDPDLDPTTIDVEVKNGHVALSGTVPRYWLVGRAGRLAADLGGVLGVENLLAVAPPDRSRDQRIAQDIVSSLDRRSNVDADSVLVTVEEGMVTLTGRVPDWYALRSAQQAAELSRGVAHVDNRLELG